MPKDGPIHKAAYKGQTDAVADLLADGVPVDSRGAQQRTPLHRAVGKGNNNVVELLIEKKANLDLVDAGGLTPLHWAALFGLTATGDLLVKGGCAIDAQTKSGETPMHLCAEKGKTDFVQFLLGKKANIEIRDNGAKGGQTPYDAAKKAKQKEIMKLLKPKGKKRFGFF